jgi:hypothetical protein
MGVSGRLTQSNRVSGSFLIKAPAVIDVLLLRRLRQIAEVAGIIHDGVKLAITTMSSVSALTSLTVRVAAPSAETERQRKRERSGPSGGVAASK